MNKISNVVEVFKNKLTDNQYEILMDSFMEVQKIENKTFTLKVVL